MLWVRSTCLVLPLLLQVHSASALRAAGQAASPPSPARAALAAGHADEALKLAEDVLRRDPLQQDANEVRIFALLSRGKIDLAVGAYDQFAGQAGRDVLPWLREIAMAELRQLGGDTARDPRLRVAALERLARGGDKSARADLERQASERMLTPDGLIVDAALVRLGDTAAAARIAQMVTSQATRDKSVIAQALKEAGATRQAYALVPLLGDDNPQTRMAAAEALGALHYGDAIAPLRLLLTDVFGPVRVAAAMALRQLGDRSGDQVLAANAGANLPDLPIVTMEAAGRSASQETVAAVTKLLDHADPLMRLRAADVLVRAGFARPACQAALLKMLGSTDHGMRQEAARILEVMGPIDPKVARQLLHDTNPWVRMYGAAALLPPPSGGARSGRA